MRARSTDTWKHGVGMASQIWFGGGGPPSYAWIRVGSDGRAHGRHRDAGHRHRARAPRWRRSPPRSSASRSTASRSCSATRRAARTRRSPPARRRRRRSGPAVRAAAADAKRQIIEIAAQRYDLEERVLDIKDGIVVSADGNVSTPLEELLGLLEDAQILGKGARGPNPTGMSVLTFGVQVVEVAVDVETGEIRVERVAAIARRRPHHQPARRAQPGRGRDHPGHRPHALRAAAARPRDRPHPDDDARRVPHADDRRRAGDRVRVRRRAGRAPDEPRLEGARRAADRPDRRRDRERDPRRDRRRRARAADLARGDAARARRPAKEKEKRGAPAAV